MLELIHKIEIEIGRRLNDEEYSIISDYIESELRMRSISEGMQQLYSWAESLPSEVKQSIIKL